MTQTTLQTLKLVEEFEVVPTSALVEVIKTLGKVGIAEAIPALLKLVEQFDPHVRECAMEALGNVTASATHQLAEVAPYLPHLLTLISTDSGTQSHGMVLAIQAACKFYNYDLTQSSPYIKLLCLYSYPDKMLCDTLSTHLTLFKRQGILTTWHAHRVVPSYMWDGITAYLNTSDIILLLISASFFASSFATDHDYDTEMQQALQRHDQGQARVIPILLKPCDWETSPFGKLQALPIAPGEGTKPVTQWENSDEAFAQIAQGIRQAAADLTQHRKPALPIASVPSENPASTINHFPNATEVKIFEQVGNYHQTP